MKTKIYKTQFKGILFFLVLSLFGLVDGYGQNQTVYWIGQSDLVNANSNCDGTGNNYYGNNPGFTWTDSLPAETQVLLVEVEYNIGISCTNPNTITPTLNSTNQTSVTFTGECTCSPTTQTYVTHTLNATNYNVDGNNTYILQGAGTTGFNKQPTSLNGNFAKITVTYGAEDDAGIEAINLASSFCAQTQDIEVELKNFGTNNITSADIEWEINGTPQTPVAYSGTLAPNATTTVLLASNFNFTNGTYIITARTNNPNNTTDGNTDNDELERTINVGAFPPTSITHTELTPNDVYTISWTGDNTQTYELEYGPFEFTLGTGTTISNISGTSQNISGINPSTNGYDVYVRSYCGGTPSAWSAPYSFGTVPFFVSNETELDAALAAAENDDVIVFLNDIVITSQKTISGKTITINGQGYELSVPVPGLDDMGRFNSNPSAFRVLQLSGSANVTINDLTIKGGTLSSGTSVTGAGGAILVNSGTTLRLNNCVISNSRTNVSTSFIGGGALGVFGVAYINNSLIIRNAANYGGAFVCNGSNARMYINNSTFAENRSTLSSGGGGVGEVNGSSIVYINNSTFSNNQSTERGGALQAGGGGTSGTIYVLNSSFTGNVTSGGQVGGAIAAYDGNAHIVNSLFAHNYAGSTSNFVLQDFNGNTGRVRIYHSIHHSNFGTVVNSDQTGNIQYGGAANGSDNTIFSGGILSLITDGTGAEIGTSQVFRPFLFNDGNSVAPTLRTGSFLLDPARAGVQTRYADNNNSNPVASYNSSGSTFTALLGSNVGVAGDLVTTDQLGETRGNPPLRGAIDDSDAGIVDDLFIVKVNASSDGTVNGGTIYGDPYPAGTTVTLTAIPNSNLQFVSWDFAAGGTASTANPYTFTVTEDVTLVPVFSSLSAGSYTITYIGNGNTGGAAPEGGTFSGSTTIAGPGTLMRSGFTFTGWNTNSNGSGTAYDPGDTYSAGQNLTLYARWQEVPANQWTGNASNLWNNAGNWSLNEVPTASSTVIIPSTSNQPVSTSSIEIASLTINSSASLTIDPTHDLKVNASLRNDGQIIFKSDATGDAYFDTFTGSISGSGTVISEKFYPDRRAFRMVASPVNGGSIYDNWQNGGVNEEGIGTHITGGSTANGFDQTTTNNASMYEFITGTGWQSVANTNSTNLAVGTPYRLMVRGDRGIDLTSNESSGATTLVASGNLEVGTKSFTFPSATGGSTTFAFVANPYQSRIDVSELLDNNLNTVATKLWVWDPMINDRGGFVVVDEIDEGQGEQTPTNSTATKFIEPGQAFFIQVTENNPSIQFTESIKDVTTSLSKPATFSDNQMSLLFELQNENNQVIDAIRLRFAADGDNGIDNLDAGKMGNLDENLASVNQNSLFTIQRRSFPEDDEVIPLFTNNWRNDNYSFKANLANFEGTTVYLVDNYLGTETLLENGEVYHFSVDAGITESTNPLRFELKFDTISLGVEELDNHLFSLYPNPAKEVVNIQTSLALGSQVSVEIYNMLGQRVYNQKQTLKASSLQVDVNNFTSGVYLVNLTDEAGNKQSTQLIKE